MMLVSMVRRHKILAAFVTLVVAAFALSYAWVADLVLVALAAWVVLAAVRAVRRRRRWWRG